MKDERAVNRIPGIEHDHDDCVERAVRSAERICRRRGLRFTAHRRKVLELVWNSHRPIGAYDILARLNTRGKVTAPPTVYRALEFLIEAHLVHRLDSLNAYIGCPDPDNPHTGQFLICRTCRSVTEMDDLDISTLVESKAQVQGFAASHLTLEVEGLCEACQDNGIS